MKSLKSILLNFIKKHYVAIFVIVITPPMWLLICWIEENRYRRLTAIAIMGVIGIISIIYAHSPAFKSAVLEKNKENSEKIE